MNPEELTQKIKSEAYRQGFDFCGATPAVTPFGTGPLTDWITAGYAGEMDYLSRRKEAYEHPKHVLDGVQSLFVLALNYQTVSAEPCYEGQGRISRYAWGDGDYHDLIHDKLKQISRSAQHLEDDIVIRGVVDTAPLLEREFAQLAGIGWQAKNTMLINRDIGSWFFLAALLINKPLKYDSAFEQDHCGSCTACLTACPTNAFAEPRVLDASKCISYLTIEHRTAIPVELRSKMGNWLFGCDICQDVCPWNNKARKTEEPAFLPFENQNPIDLVELFDLDDDQFRLRFRKTPLWRPKRRGILRNAAIILGNNPCEKAISALAKGLQDAEPLIRGASAWALGRQPQQRAKLILADRQKIETDEMVLSEIVDALKQE